MEEHEFVDIKLPTRENPEDFTIPTSTTSIAYWGCRGILAVDNLGVFITCGGGDGGAASSSIVRIDLQTYNYIEKAFCNFSAVTKYKEVCYKQNGEIYHSVLN
ncbi:hypothetical protein HYU92_00545 [Candidatus Curtissbacteria bacterium]|nr:hypothetical protein [Candidatus Curtissbacteria bacterium]